MTEEDLEKIRKKYIDLSDKNDISQRQKIFLAFSEIDKLSLLNSNNIMVYMGTYASKYTEIGNTFTVDEILLDEYDINAKYRKYKNLENEIEVDIDLDFCDFYEDNNKIVFIPNSSPIESKEIYYQNFYLLKEYFCKLLLYFSQDKAINRIMDKENINTIFSVEKFMNDNNIRSFLYDMFRESAVMNQKLSLKYKDVKSYQESI